MVREVLPRLSAAAVPGASEAARAALEAATRWLEKTVEVLPEEVAAAWLRTWDRLLPSPDRTVLLRPFEEVAYCSWVKRAIDEAERARALGMWGFALSALGRRAEALQATQEAVEIRRRLAAQHPDAFLPDLAGSLHNLGLMLSEMGRRAEALQAAQEAVEIRRRLAEQHPDAFLPDLARSLTNLGNVLSKLGRWAEALEATQEAVDLYCRLAEQHPDAFLPYLPYLAASLTNLGNVLSEMGRREEALQATQKAVDLYRWLAEQHPDAFLPDLARSLGAYGLVLLGLGRSAEAAAAFAEGLRAILPFARALPAVFSGLASALLQGYLRACAEAGEAPDEALVAQARR
jgi:tetratricopeptide (TPR) repeat protein